MDMREPLKDIELNGEKVSGQQKQMSPKKKVIIEIVSAVVILALVIPIAYNSGHTASVDEIAAQDAQNIKLNQDSDYTSKKSELKSITAKVDKLSSYESQLEDYSKNKSNYDSQIAQAKSSLNDVNTQISLAQSKLKGLNNDIAVAKGAPKVLSAGQFTVGKDIPSGRYSISGSSNFCVYDANGDILVNTILGNSEVGVGNYTCTLDEGNIIKTESKTTFTPIN